jgi:hypothetical protein
MSDLLRIVRAAAIGGSFIMGALLIASGTAGAKTKTLIVIQPGPGYGEKPLPGLYSCEAAGRKVYFRGYRAIRVIDCNSAVYKFSAGKSGFRWEVSVSAANARVLSRRQLPR